jgi:hypothetical protein
MTSGQLLLQLGLVPLQLRDPRVPRIGRRAALRLPQPGQCPGIASAGTWSLYRRAAAPVSDRAVRPVRAVSFADSLVGASWDPGQFAYLILLWNVESGWNPAAANPISGAFGVPGRCRP